MHSTRRVAPFRTEIIDLATYLAAVGFEPQVTCSLGCDRALFRFEESRGLNADVLEYEQGAPLPENRLLNRRSWLYREASRAVRERERQ